jgi:hypothetical protein
MDKELSRLSVGLVRDECWRKKDERFALRKIVTKKLFQK